MDKSSEASTLPSTRVATVNRAPAEEQRNAVTSRSREHACATKVTDSTTASNWRHPGNAYVVLTELFRKAMDTMGPSATKVRHSKPGAEDNPSEVFAKEVDHPANKVEKIIEGDSSYVLSGPVKPSRKTRPNLTHSH